tara:strand:- start:2703 stop:3071 length:369 start_codon:yes stop_codon:yes gene_type:complete
MFLEIIFIVLVIVGIISISKSDYPGDSFGGWLIAVIFGIALLVNTIELFTVSYEFEVYEKEMEAYQETLDNIRANKVEFETATIAFDVIQVNTRLARLKRENKSWFYDIYLDDRIDSIKPIK